MPSQTTYKGDTPGKSITRLEEYSQIKKKMPGGPPENTLAVALAGPEACDALEFTRLGYRPENIWLVDVVDTGLKVAKRILPGCRTWHGTMEDFLLSIHTCRNLGYQCEISLMIADYMGGPTEAVRQDFSLLGPLLSPKAIVSYTHVMSHKDVSASHRRSSVLAAMQIVQGTLGYRDEKTARKLSRIANYTCDIVAAMRLNHKGPLDFNCFWNKIYYSGSSMHTMLLEKVEGISKTYRRPEQTMPCPVCFRIKEKGHEKTRHVYCSRSCASRAYWDLQKR